jgi:hypothetical protein
MNSGSVSKTRSEVPILLAALLLVLASCQNPASQGFNALSVVRTSPQDGGQRVDPGQPITVTFSKPLDFPWLQQNAGAITITPAVDIDLDFDHATNTLSVTAHPYLVGPNQLYTVTLSAGLKAASGDTLAEPTTWSFTTGDAPAGDVKIAGTPFTDGKFYTNGTRVPLNIECNPSVALIRIASTEADLDRATPAAVTSSSYSTVWTLETGDGPQTAWVQFQSRQGALSTAKAATVIRDATAPVVQPITLPMYYGPRVTTVVPTVTAADASGIAHYFWSSSPAGIGFVPADCAAPAMTIPGPDGGYAVSLRVADPAGNTSSPQTATIWKDTTAPGKPSTDGGLKWGATVSPQLSLTPTWVLPVPGTSSNPYPVPDIYVVQVDNQPPVQVSLPSSVSNSYTSPANLSDSSDHTLTVWQQDAAGNMSIPAGPIHVTVTPVLPVDGSTEVTMMSLRLRWRDFDSLHGYTVYLAPHGSAFAGSGALPAGVTGWSPPPLSPNTPYDWYIAGSSGARMPPDPTENYSFTTGPK